MPKGKFLAEFEIYVMLALARLGDNAYGVSVRREIRARTGRPTSIGAVYATLGRLEDKGLVTHRVSEPRPVPGGRSRKYYELTPEGERALDHSTRMLRRMMEDVEVAPEAGS